jgi:hypothetical protein
MFTDVTYDIVPVTKPIGIWWMDVLVDWLKVFTLRMVYTATITGITILTLCEIHIYFYLFLQLMNQKTSMKLHEET